LRIVGQSDRMDRLGHAQTCAIGSFRQGRSFAWRR
jgi:hypothetical protein